MKLQSVIKKGFLMRADGELKATEEVFAVRHFLNGFICDL
jgi:hypothetical protein